MKLIGIIGKSGSGKTTFSRMLEKDDCVGVIHLDEVFNMKELKQKMPSALIDKTIYSNAQGEEFMMLNERVRKVKELMIKNKLLRNMYFGILNIPREKLVKQAISKKIEQGKKVIIIEGCMLGNLSVYKDIDYLIQINAPFAEREKRAIERKDLFFSKQAMVERDLDFKKAQRNGAKKGKVVDQLIQNVGSKEDLQKVADRIYGEQIRDEIPKPKETMQEKYGGYETKPITRTQLEKMNNRQKDDLSK